MMEVDSQEESIPIELIEAAEKASADLLPKKSKEKYENAYNAFNKWRRAHTTNSSSETILLAYFQELSTKLKPSSLWSIYSMLKSTLNIKEKVNIATYRILTAFLKEQSEGFISRKSNILTPEQVQTFLKNAPDNEYLAVKIALIFGICGACRSNELVNVKLQDITKQGNLIVVKIPTTKTKKPRTFVITDEFSEKVESYEALRPETTKTDRFFLNFQKGKCTTQVIGIHKFSNMPKQIARFLDLENPDSYTGHAFRRSSATFLANSGANITTLERHGGWKSSAVAEGYIEESIQNKAKIGRMIASSMIEISAGSSKESAPEYSPLEDKNVENVSNNPEMLPLGGKNVKNMSNIPSPPSIRHKIPNVPNSNTSNLRIKNTSPKEGTMIFNNCSFTINSSKDLQNI